MDRQTVKGILVKLFVRLNPIRSLPLGTSKQYSVRFGGGSARELLPRFQNSCKTLCNTPGILKRNRQSTYRRAEARVDC
jgi:hypothetical protein